MTVYRRTAVWLSVVGALTAWSAAPGAQAEMAPEAPGMTEAAARVETTPEASGKMAPAETCTVIKETKIQGASCKALILNGCSHEVELNIHYEVALRQTVILPVLAEGPAYEYRDGGTAKADETGKLMAGESRWFTYTSPGHPSAASAQEGGEKIQIEVAKCKVGFDYVYQPK